MRGFTTDNTVLLDSLVQANILDAKAYLSRVAHQGGSNFFAGLRVGLDLLRIDEAKPMVASLIFITDGYARSATTNASVASGC